MMFGRLGFEWRVSAEMRILMIMQVGRGWLASHVVSTSMSLVDIIPSSPTSITEVISESSTYNLND